jgi:hypothetical protein
MGKNGSKWKHGWVPANFAAAVIKAHGSKTAAIDGARRRTAKRQKLARAQAGVARAMRRR